MFNKNEHSQVPLPNRSAPFMNAIVVSAVGVIKLLKGLNPSKALGPDGLHPRVLKELASELGPMFAHLFQQSIDTGEIPKEWSLANTCPLFIKKVIGLWLAITVRSPFLVYGASCLHTQYALISWHMWTNINFCQIDNMHSERGTAVKLS